MAELKLALERVRGAMRTQLEQRLNPQARADFEPHFLSLYERCRPYTMTSVERMYGLYEAIRYVVREDIPGDIVECGVWRGGSSMLAALTLKELRDKNKRIHLYDTFAGMSEPSAEDGSDARVEWEANEANGHNEWCYAPLEHVQRNLRSTGLDDERLLFVRGTVEQTIPSKMPPSIAVLRLDTDWYESTLHELEHLYPALSTRGVLIVDDYGHWTGARRAVDEYFDQVGHHPLLARLDYTGRMCVKA